VHFLHKLRDEKKYPDLPSLAQQIGLDVLDARNFFRTSLGPATSDNKLISN
jgi:riboflavin kinase/FMN adenylyltransferase